MNAPAERSAAAAPTPHHAGSLTIPQGTALYVGAVLGTGVIALPALTAEVAGPASLVAWAALVVLSIRDAGRHAPCDCALQSEHRLRDEPALDAFVRAADGASYRAKTGQRDRVVAADSLAPSTY